VRVPPFRSFQLLFASVRYLVASLNAVYRPSQTRRFGLPGGFLPGGGKRVGGLKYGISRKYGKSSNPEFLALFDMFLFYVWPFCMCVFCKKSKLFSTLILPLQRLCRPLRDVTGVAYFSQPTSVTKESPIGLLLGFDF